LILAHFVNWSPGQPDNNFGLENCVHIWMDQGFWNDAECDSSTFRPHQSTMCEVLFWNVDYDIFKNSKNNKLHQNYLQVLIIFRLSCHENLFCFGLNVQFVTLFLEATKYVFIKARTCNYFLHSEKKVQFPEKLICSFIRHFCKKLNRSGIVHCSILYLHYSIHFLFKMSWI